MSGILERVIRLGVMASLLASVSFVASPTIVSQPAAAATCSVTSSGTPFKVTGPAVKATGTARCDTSIYNLQVRVRIYAKDCATCSWYLFADSGFKNCFNCAVHTRSHQAFCSGTRQYFSHTDGYRSFDGQTYIFLNGVSSAATTISC